MESASKANKIADNSIVLRVDITMELAAKVHKKKTKNMESKLLVCGVLELKRGLCWLNVSKRSFNDTCE